MSYFPAVGRRLWLRRRTANATVSTGTPTLSGAAETSPILWKVTVTIAGTFTNIKIGQSITSTGGTGVIAAGTTVDSVSSDGTILYLSKAPGTDGAVTSVTTTATLETSTTMYLPMIHAKGLRSLAVRAKSTSGATTHTLTLEGSINGVDWSTDRITAGDFADNGGEAITGQDCSSGGGRMRIFFPVNDPTWSPWDFLRLAIVTSGAGATGFGVDALALYADGIPIIEPGAVNYVAPTAL